MSLQTSKRTRFVGINGVIRQAQPIGGVRIVIPTNLSMSVGRCWRMKKFQEQQILFKIVFQRDKETAMRNEHILDLNLYQILINQHFRQDMMFAIIAKIFPDTFHSLPCLSIIYDFRQDMMFICQIVSYAVNFISYNNNNNKKTVFYLTSSASIFLFQFLSFFHYCTQKNSRSC